MKNTSLCNNNLLLNGQWRFRADPENKGINEKWYQHLLDDSIKLPGTMDENCKGIKSEIKPELTQEVLRHLNRKYSYTGKAWYQKEIVIPEKWMNKRVVLSLERVIWETQVWVDNKHIGMKNSLSVPHIYDVTQAMAPGKHLLTIMVDNTQKYNLGSMTHAYSDETQTIWNGIVGAIQLYATDKIWLSDVQIYPNLAEKKIRADVMLKKDVKHKVSGAIKLKTKSCSVKDVELTEKVIDFDFDEHFALFHMDYDMGKDVLLWDEFEPNLYDLTVTVESNDGKSFYDQRNVSFGMRNFVANGKELRVNDKKIFLRGTLECCVFPLTGYPFMDVENWQSIFKTARSYGLNHLRFHSWCPPEAAFLAADIEGFYLHIELPVWTYDLGKDLRRDDFLVSEANRIVETYGNHPSFCMMAMGNELEGDFNYLHKLVKHLQDKDPRHLYTSTTFTFQEPHGKWPEPVDEFFITQQTLKGWIRGQGFFNEKLPRTNEDVSSAMEGIDVPVVSHEIGQYSVYPSMKEISKYTGVLEPLNFIAVKEDLKKKGLLEKADAFTQASGKFSLLLYKEDIELILRTQQLSGFQLLDLHDFPGQSTSLVGILDAFWDTKGIVAPEDFRCFCSSTVPLLRMPKKVYKANEDFSAKIEVSHFGDSDLHDVKIRWCIKDSKNQILTEDQIKKETLPTGRNTDITEISYDLMNIKQADELKIEVMLCGTQAANSWNIWVYPDVEINHSDVIISKEFDDKTKKALHEGKNVLLLADSTSLKASIPGTFVPVFWSPVHFPDQPGTMGLLCDNEHPALSDFPTKKHSDWQWWDLTKNSCAMIIDDLPDEFEPIVRVIDNFSRNHSLANLFETKAYNGKLIVCSIDLQDDIENRPAARQLLYSILNYMKSDNFNPTLELNEDNLKSVFN